MKYRNEAQDETLKNKALKMRGASLFMYTWLGASLTKKKTRDSPMSQLTKPLESRRDE
jgi:hypothetical protein